MSSNFTCAKDMARSDSYRKLTFPGRFPYPSAGFLGYDQRF